MPMSMDMPMTPNPIFFSTRRHFVSRSCSSGCRSLYFRFPRLVHSQPFIKQQRKDWWLQSSIVKNLSWLHCHWWLHYPSVPNPGRSWFDTTMSMSVHNSKICSKAFYGHVQNSAYKEVPQSWDYKTLVHAFVSSHLDHCNSLLYDVPNYQSDHLQKVLTAAASLTLLAYPSSHQSCATCTDFLWFIVFSLNCYFLFTKLLSLRLTHKD